MIRLMKHQLDTVRLCRHVDNHGLLWTMGTGKTLTMWTIILDLIRSGKAKSALIVCPIQVIGAWTDDLKKLGTRAQDDLSNVKIVNYEKLIRRKEISDVSWDVIVVDESHKIANRKAVRTKTLLNMVRPDQCRYILSGTPVGNARMEDYFSQMAFLLGSDFPYKSYKAFLDDFFSYELAENRNTKSRYYNSIMCSKIDDLLNWIRPSTSRFDKSVLLDLPDPLPPVIHKVEMSDKNRNIYKEVRKHRFSKIGDAKIVADHLLTLRIRLRQLSSGIFAGEDGYREQLVDSSGYTPKIAALCQIMESRGILADNRYTGAGDKLVIFTNWVESMRSIAMFLRRAGIPYEQMGDGHSGSEHWQNFQNDPKIKIFIGNYKSVSEGANLNAADTIVFFEPTESSLEDTQARSRIHRKGQTGLCSYIYLIADGTIEETIYKALSQYEDFTDVMFNKYLELQ